MTKSVTCLLNEQEIGVDEALRLRDSPGACNGSSLDFRCVDCKEAVRPHREGGHMASHFEHLARNAKCELSHSLK